MSIKTLGSWGQIDTINSFLQRVWITNWRRLKVSSLLSCLSSCLQGHTNLDWGSLSFTMGQTIRSASYWKTLKTRFMWCTVVDLFSRVLPSPCSKCGSNRHCPKYCPVQGFWTVPTATCSALTKHQALDAAKSCKRVSSKFLISWPVQLDESCDYKSPKSIKIPKKWDLKLLKFWMGQSSKSSPPPVDRLTSAAQVHGACQWLQWKVQREKLLGIGFCSKLLYCSLPNILAIPVASLPNPAARSQPPHWEVALETKPEPSDPQHNNFEARCAANPSSVMTQLTIEALPMTWIWPRIQVSFTTHVLSHFASHLWSVLWIAELGGHVEHECVIPFQLIVTFKQHRHLRRKNKGKQEKKQA